MVVGHRLTSLTPDIQERIVKLIEKGNYIEVACRACGICTATYYNWLARGEAGEEPFLGFLEAIQDAEAIAETRMVETINKVASSDEDNTGDWKAAMEYLGRKLPDRWGRKERIEHVGDKDKPINIKIDYKKIKDDDLRELDRILTGVGSERDQEGTGETPSD